MRISPALMASITDSLAPRVRRRVDALLADPVPIGPEIGFGNATVRLADVEVATSEEHITCNCLLSPGCAHRAAVALSLEVADDETPAAPSIDLRNPAERLRRIAEEAARAGACAITREQSATADLAWEHLTEVLLRGAGRLGAAQRAGLAADLHRDMARRLLEELRPEIDDDELIDSLLAAKQRMESGLARQAARVDRLKARLAELEGPKIEDLKSVCDHLLRRSVWIVGGDGWAYDIGSSGVDHVLASGRNVNVLVLDTEVYSNTGGQASKSTPLGAVAKFASAGKHTNKKDMAMQAMAYGSVYVARVAMGADPQQTLKAFREAEAYEGPSLIIAYSHCIAHGIDTRKGLEQQYRAVNSGHWPLMRYNPVIRENGGNPFLLDSPRPRLRLREYQDAELRYKVLRAADPEEANRLIDIAQAQVDRRWAEYEELALRGAEKFAADPRKEESWQI